MVEVLEKRLLYLHESNSNGNFKHRILEKIFSYFVLVAVPVLHFGKFKISGRPILFLLHSIAPFLRIVQKRVVFVMKNTLTLSSTSKISQF